MGRSDDPGADHSGSSVLAARDISGCVSGGAVYRLGVALHDLQNPAKVISVGDSWILQPEDPWETTGYVHNVVFTCDAVPEPDGTVKIYWGGADNESVGSGRALLQHNRPSK